MGTQSFAFTVDLCHPCGGGPDGHKENNKATGMGWRGSQRGSAVEGQSTQEVRPGNREQGGDQSITV